VPPGAKKPGSNENETFYMKFHTSDLNVFWMSIADPVLSGDHARHDDSYLNFI